MPDLIYNKRSRVWFSLSVLALLIALASSIALSQDGATDYRGNVYVEIRIDDDGIILIDSTGTETMVPLGVIRDDGSFEDRQELPQDLDIDLSRFPHRINRISVIGRSVVVDYDERVFGGVSVIGGDVTVRGLVEGSIATTGEVRLESTAIVIGDIIGKDVIRSPGARVTGTIARSSFIPGAEAPWGPADHDPTAAFITCIVYMSVLLLITFVVAMVFRTATDRVKELYNRNILKTLLFGFITWLLLLPVYILLLITIIGIPVAVLGMPLAVLAASFLGGAAFSLFVSDFLKTGENGKHESRATKVLMGFAVVQIPTVGFFLGLMVNSEALSIVSGIMAGLLNLLVITLGFGAAILTRFGTRDYHDGKVTFKVEVVDDDDSATATNPG